MKHLSKEKENMQLNKANASHPYTLSSRTSQPADQNLPKSMAVPTHGQTEENKARAHNKVYSLWRVTY